MSPHFSTYELPNYNCLKRYMQFQWQFHTVSLFPWLTSKTKRWNFGLCIPHPWIKLETSHLPIPPPSHLSNHINLPPFPPSHFPSLTILPSTIKALQNNNIGPSMSLHWFLSKGSQYQSWKANFHILYVWTLDLSYDLLNIRPLKYVQCE